MGKPRATGLAARTHALPLPRPAADQLAVAVLTLDAHGTAEYANPAWVALSGLDPEASRGAGWSRLLAPADRARLVHQLAHSSGAVDCALDGSGGRRWTRWLWHEQHGAHGRARVVSVLDLSADRSREDRLAEEAARDPLTRVANRRSFVAQVRAALGRESSGNVGVVYIDLDGFKQVNDTGGHALGDALLRLVAQRLRRHLRSSDLLGRVGGDEFAVLCLGPTWELMSVAGRVSSALFEPFRIDDTTLTVSAAVGVAVADPSDDDPEELLSRADRDMYRAKNHSAQGEAAAPAPRDLDAPGAVRLPPVTADMVVRRLYATGLVLAAQGDEPPAAGGHRIERAISQIEALVRDLQAASLGARSEDTEA